MSWMVGFGQHVARPPVRPLLSREARSLHLCVGCGACFLGLST